MTIVYWALLCRFLTKMYELMMVPVKATSNSMNNMLRFGSSIIIVPYSMMNNVITKHDMHDDAPNMVPINCKFFMFIINLVEKINKL
jgi:hypothetical protein